jgi:hypothetical protein
MQREFMTIFPTRLRKHGATLMLNKLYERCEHRTKARPCKATRCMEFRETSQKCLDEQGQSYKGMDKQQRTMRATAL